MRAIISEITSIVIVIIGFLWFGSLGGAPKADISEELADKPCQSYIDWKQERETETEVVTTEAETVPVLPPVELEQAFTQEEQIWLLKIAVAEAGNLDAIGQALIMRVVINLSDAWHMSIPSVISKPGVFAAYTMPELWNREPNANTWQALALVMDGWDGSQGALYFCTPAASSFHDSHFTYLFSYQNAKFYR